MDLPYRNFASYLRERFGGRVIKIPVDAGFTCPNRDGTLGEGGCAFCANESFSPPVRRAAEPVVDQVRKAVEAHRRRDPDARFMVYFQAFTNTHAPPERLAALYAETLLDGVVALAVGTRPDAVPDPVLDVFPPLFDRVEVWLELGLQSAHDATLARIDRRHDAACFADATKRASKRGLKTLAHVILGLPGEGPEEVRGTARFLAALPVDGVKIHHLYVAESTPLARAFQQGRVETPTPETHVRLVADFLERLPSRVVVQRLVSDPEPSLLLAPKWEAPKADVLSMIVEEFRRRGTRQGSLHPVDR
ncbi:MAG: tRNA modification radical SAM protein MnmL/YtqA [Planctomycetota bacterium]|jgi:radical SAM protein (TIGR01212 family)